MIKKLIVLIIAGILILVSGILIYSHIQTKEQNAAVSLSKQYVMYIMSDQPEEAKGLLSSSQSDDVVISFDDLESKVATDMILAANQALVDADNYFKLVKVEKKNGIYEVTAKMIYPDFPSLYFDLPRYGILTDWGASVNYVKQVGADGTMPVSERDITFYIVRESGKQKIQFSLS